MCCWKVCPVWQKTLAIKTLASLIDAQYSRIQFTPDLLPADVIGTMVYSQKDETFQVKKGPVFANFIVADEINCAPAKVQSALLEAMQERQVTIGAKRRCRNLFGACNSNPIEHSVTQRRRPFYAEGSYPNWKKKKINYTPEYKRRKTECKAHSESRRDYQARRVVRQVYLDEKIENILSILYLQTRYPEKYDLKELKDMIGFGGSPCIINLALAAVMFHQTPWLCYPGRCAPWHMMYCATASVWLMKLKQAIWLPDEIVSKNIEPRLNALM